MALPAESGGVTVPTAETAADGVDVEDGGEDLSTPQEPFVGMSFNTSDAVKRLLQFLCLSYRFLHKD